MWSLKCPVLLAIQVDKALEQWNGKIPLGAPDSLNLLGGHYIYVFGYDTMADGTRIFYWCNSWGLGWGLNGIGLANSMFIFGTTDGYALTLRKL